MANQEGKESNNSIDIAALENQLSALAKENTKEYVDILNKLSRLYFRTIPKHSEKLANKSIAISKSLSYQQGLCQGYIELVEPQISLGKFDLASKNAQKAIDLSKELGDYESLIRAQNQLGSCYYYLADSQKALALFLDNYKLAKKYANLEFEANSLNNIACIHADLGNYYNALEHFMLLYKYTVDHNINNKIGLSLLNIGITYLDLEKNEEALPYLLKSEAYLKNIPEHSANLYNSLSSYNFRVGNYEQALKYGKKSLKRYQSITNPHGIMESLISLGKTYSELKQTKKAENHLIEALTLSANHNEKNTTAKIRLALGKLYLGQSKTQKSIEMLYKVLDLGHNHKNLNFEAHLVLSNIYEQNKDLEKALYHHKEYVAIKDKVFNIQSEQRLESLQVTLEVEQAEREKELVKKQNKDLAEANNRLKQLNKSLGKLDRQKSDLVKKLSEQAYRDSLTGLYNRRYFDENLSLEFLRAGDLELPLTVMICDIDNFKAVNDNFSHQVGDQVLVKIAELLVDNIRKDDILARYGGEEFILMMPETDISIAAKISDRLRESVENYPWNSIQKGLKVTISQGLANKTTVSNYEKLISLADDKLYEAKNSGKNKLCY